MAGYQSFPGRDGDSDSMRKLAALALPPLAAKSFLDLGCNEGYFCGYAFFDGASRIVGVDCNESFLKQARMKFPQCDFRNGNWEDLGSVLKPEEKFDVILCASALHYASDQPAAVAGFMERLKPGGTLVLEIGLAQPADGTAQDGWLRVKRSIDERLFPDQRGLAAMLKPFVYKHMGRSVPQAGDPIGREVFHVRHKKPYALLLMDDPGSGKSTLADMAFGKLPIIKGDVIISTNARELSQLLDEPYNDQNISRMLEKLLSSGAASGYVKLLASLAAGRSFVYDGYIPPQHREEFKKELEKLGYMPVSLTLPDQEYGINELSRRARQEARKYQILLGAMRGGRW